MATKASHTRVEKLASVFAVAADKNDVLKRGGAAASNCEAATGSSFGLLRRGCWQ